MKASRSKKRSWISKLGDVFFRPKYFFTRIVADGKMEDAILKAFLWGLLGGIIVFIMNICQGNPLTIFSFFKAIVAYPVIAIVLLFVCAGLMMLVSEITGGERDWEITVKGVASIFFVYPFALILYSLAFDCTSMWMISIAIDLYGKRVSVLFVLMVSMVILACLYMSDYRTVWFLVKNIPATLTCL